MSEYLCKDCKYSNIPLMTKIGNIIFFLKNEDFEYVCTRSRTIPVVKHSPVVGTFIQKPIRDYVRCHEERQVVLILNWDAKYLDKEDSCGPNGKYWTPKNKNDLFKYLKKEHNE